MSDAETNVNTILTGNADVKRIVNTRIYPLVMPQDPTLPAITYQRINAAPVNTLSGYAGLMNPHIVINSWATDYAAVKELAFSVRTAMNTSVTLRNVLVNELDGFEPDINLFVVSQDFSCWSIE